MKFSVIIPTYNDWERLQKCLAALERQNIAKDQFEIIVVNNAQSEIAPSVFDLPEEIQLIHEPSPGSYAARNGGVTVAKGKILAFTDSDCIPDKNWLANAEGHFSRSRCDLLGGRVDIFQTKPGNKYGYLYERLTAFQQHRNVPEGRGVTANLFVKKTVFEEVGGFNPAIKSGGDWQFTLGCTQRGYSMIYGDDVAVRHPARDLYSIFKKFYRLTCGGAVNVKEEYGHSYLRMLGSHLLHGLRQEREYLTEPSRREQMIIFSIDFLKYIYRTVIYGGLVFHVIDPQKVRE